jgi:hypothetical protein
LRYAIATDLSCSLLLTRLVTGIDEAFTVTKLTRVNHGTVAIAITSSLVLTVLSYAIDTLLEWLMLDTCLNTCICKLTCAKVTFVELDSISIALTCAYFVLVYSYAVDTDIEYACTLT